MCKPYSKKYVCTLYISPGISFTHIYEQPINLSMYSEFLSNIMPCNS